MDERCLYVPSPQPLSPGAGSIRPSPGFQLPRGARPGVLPHAILYKLGVDGISMPFVLLTTFLMPICPIAASWTSIQNRVKEYMVWFPCCSR